MSDTAVEDFLEHAGVKGMKWGQRKAPSDSGANAPAKTKKAKVTTEEIKAARERQNKRAAALNVKAMETYTQKTKKGEAAARESYFKAEKKFLEHPDMATGSKLTKGEKVATAAVATLYGTVLVGMFAASANSVGKSSYNRSSGSSSVFNPDRT